MTIGTIGKEKTQRGGPRKDKVVDRFCFLARSIPIQFDAVDARTPKIRKKRIEMCTVALHTFDFVVPKVPKMWHNYKAVIFMHRPHDILDSRFSKPIFGKPTRDEPFLLEFPVSFRLRH